MIQSTLCGWILKRQYIASLSQVQNIASICNYVKVKMRNNELPVSEYLYVCLNTCRWSSSCQRKQVQ